MEIENTVSRFISQRDSVVQARLIKFVHGLMDGYQSTIAGNLARLSEDESEMALAITCFMGIEEP